ncbi:40392_t:CDS:1, partial [Gigaspora margarita]
SAELQTNDNEDNDKSSNNSLIPQINISNCNNINVDIKISFK